MSNNGLTLMVKEMPSMLVAGIRFTGHTHQVGPTLCSLYDSVKRYIRGKPMCLYHATDARKIRRDVEACFPVAYPVNTGAVKSYLLEGGTMICMQYGGMNGSRCSLRTVNEAWKLLRDEMSERGIPIVSGPRREVYFVESSDSGHDTRGYVTELQIPVVLTPEVLELLGNCNERTERMTNSCLPEKRYWEEQCIEEDARCVQSPR